MRTTLNLNEIIAQWLSECDILPSTALDYERKLALWFLWLSAAGVDTRSPERRHVVEYKQYLQREGRSLLTVNGLVTVVKLFYGFCERRGYCDNIAAGIRSSCRRSGYSKLPLTAEQARRLLESIDTTTVIGRRDRLMLSLMLFNGLRTCEVERIDLGDFAEREGEPVLVVQRKGRTEKNEIVVAALDVVRVVGEVYLRAMVDATLETHRLLLAQHLQQRHDMPGSRLATGQCGIGRDIPGLARKKCTLDLSRGAVVAGCALRDAVLCGECRD